MKHHKIINDSVDFPKPYQRSTSCYVSRSYKYNAIFSDVQSFSEGLPALVVNFFLSKTI